MSQNTLTRALVFCSFTTTAFPFVVLRELSVCAGRAWTCMLLPNYAKMLYKLCTPDAYVRASHRWCTNISDNTRIDYAVCIKSNAFHQWSIFFDDRRLCSPLSLCSEVYLLCWAQVRPIKTWTFNRLCSVSFIVTTTRNIWHGQAVCPPLLNWQWYETRHRANAMRLLIFAKRRIARQSLPHYATWCSIFLFWGLVRDYVVYRNFFDNLRPIFGAITVSWALGRIGPIWLIVTY